MDLKDDDRMPWKTSRLTASGCSVGLLGLAAGAAVVSRTSRSVPVRRPRHGADADFRGGGASAGEVDHDRLHRPTIKAAPCWPSWGRRWPALAQPPPRSAPLLDLATETQQRRVYTVQWQSRGIGRWNRRLVGVPRTPSERQGPTHKRHNGEIIDRTTAAAHVWMGIGPLFQRNHIPYGESA